MGGMFGIGGSGATTDRSSVLSGRSNLQSIFNWGMPEGQNGAATGQGTLDTALGTQSDALKTLQPAEQYWTNLMGAGRQQIAQMSAPATDAVVAGKDAATKQTAQFGTGRSGGGVAAQATAGTTSQSQIDNIINQNLMTAGNTGAAGLEQVAGVKSNIGGAQAGVGTTELSTALSELGLSESAVNEIINNSQQSWNAIEGRNTDIGGGIGSLFGEMLLGVPGSSDSWGGLL